MIHRWFTALPLPGAGHSEFAGAALGLAPDTSGTNAATNTVPGSGHWQELRPIASTSELTRLSWENVEAWLP